MRVFRTIEHQYGLLLFDESDPMIIALTQGAWSMTEPD